MPDYGTAFTLVIAWAALGLIVAIPVTMLLKAWSEGTVDALTAIGAAATILILLAFTWQTQGTIWMLVFVALLLGCCVGLPFLSLQAGKRTSRDLHEEDIAKCRRAIELDPNNASAHAFLGDAFMESKTYVAAAAQYERAIALSQENSAARPGDPADRGNPALASWKRKLQKAQEAQAGIAHATRLMVCGCGQENPPERKKCERCGARLQIGFGR